MAKRLLLLLLVASLGLLVWRWRDVEQAPRSTPQALHGSADDRSGEPQVSDDLEPPSEDARATLASAADAPRAPALAAADASIVLRGTVRHADGAPVPNASVRATSTREERDARAAADGAYELRGLTAGDWALSCDATGYVPQRRKAALEAARPEPREDFVLARALVIPVRFLGPNGVPVEHDPAFGNPRFVDDLRVIATREAPDEPADLRDAESRYESKLARSPEDAQRLDLPSGVLTIVEPLPLHVSLALAEEVLETRRLESLVDELSFTLEPADVVRRLAGFSVRITDAGTGAVPLKAQAILQPSSTTAFRADERGEVRVGGIHPGTYRLRLIAPGKAYATLHFELRAGEQRDLGTVALGERVAIEGQLVDPDGRPCGGWQRLHDARRPVPSDANTSMSSAIASDGRFKSSVSHDVAILELGAGADPGPPRGSAFSNRHDRGTALLARVRRYEKAQGPWLAEVVPLERASEVWLVPQGELPRDTRYQVLLGPEGPALRRGRIDLLPELVYLLPGDYRLEVLDRRGEVWLARSITVGTGPLEVAVGPREGAGR